jgi:hypothetical protein
MIHAASTPVQDNIMHLHIGSSYILITKSTYRTLHLQQAQAIIKPEV